MYKLHFLINVFGVSPTFLLPIFKKENHYFFQVIENGEIVSFEKADLKQFKNCKRYYVKSLTYMVHENYPPVFGIETYDCNDYYIGKQTDILYYFECNIDKYRQFGHFCHSMNNFKKSDFRSDNKWELTVCKKNNQYISPLNIKPRLIETYHYRNFEETLYNKNLFSNNYIQIKKYILLRDRTRKRNLRIIERQNKNILFNLDACFESDNMFDILEIVNNKKLFSDHSIIVNNKIRSNIPLSIQIDILKTIYKKNFLFSSNEIYNYYSRKNFSNTFYSLTNHDIKIMMKYDWNLNLSSTQNTISLYDNTISSIESKNTFYFGVKKISKKDYAIIAENIYTNELYVVFNNINLNSDDVISFIKYLYSKIKHTVSLIPCCDESTAKVFNDEFSRWLELNEDVCLIKGLQNFVSTHFY